MWNFYNIMIKRGVLVFILSFAICILFLNSVSSHLGMKPAKVEMDFQPGGELYVNYYVDTTPETKLRVYATGDFADYVDFNKEEFKGSGSFIAHLKMPNQPEKPGPNNLFIRTEQVLDEGVGVGTSISIGALIRINVPYPGKYIELSFDVENVNQGEPLNFNLEVVSKGKETIDAVAYIDIYSGEDKLDYFNMGRKTLALNEKHNFKKVISTEGYSPGIYKAVATVIYGDGDGERESIEKDFRIGHLYVDIINYTTEVVSGKINPFFINVQSEWKHPVKDIYANVSLGNSSNSNFFSFLTPPVTINGFQPYQLGGFIDAQNIPIGEYDINISLYYMGKITSKLDVIQVIKERKGNLLFIILGAIVALIVICAVYFFIIKKRKKK